MKKSTLTSDVVLEYIKQNEPVTYRELQSKFNVGSSVIVGIVNYLRSQKFLQANNGKSGIKTIGYATRAGLQTRLDFQIAYNKILAGRLVKLQARLTKCEENN